MKIISKLKTATLGALALVVATLLTTFTLPASAADGAIEMSVSPINDKAALIPGKSYSAAVKVHVNADSMSAVEYKAYVLPLTITSDNYNSPDYKTKTSSNDIVDWITFDDGTDTGLIQPNETKVINYTVNVPKDATPGGQYAVIMIEDTADEQDTTGALNVGAKYRLSYEIYGTVAGDVDEKGSVLENNINTFFLDSKISGTSIVENTGNVHFDAQYTLRVFPLFSDEEIYSNEENPDTWIIMPNTTRFISTTWEETPTFGIFNVEQEVKIFDQVSKTTKLVIVIPIWLLLAIVFVIVFWIIWLVMRNKNRKAAAKGKGKSSPSPTSATSAKSENSTKPESRSDTTD